MAQTDNRGEQIVNELINNLNDAADFEHSYVDRAAHYISSMVTLIEEGEYDKRFDSFRDQLDHLLRDQAGFQDRTSIIWWWDEEQPKTVLDFEIPDPDEREKIGHEIVQWLSRTYRLFYNWISRGLQPRIGICRHCGAAYAKARSDQRYCSSSHRVTAHQKREREAEIQNTNG